jgi:hypothetical protein
LADAASLAENKALRTVLFLEPLDAISSSKLGRNALQKITLQTGQTTAVVIDRLHMDGVRRNGDGVGDPRQPQRQFYPELGLQRPRDVHDQVGVQVAAVRGGGVLDAPDEIGWGAAASVMPQPAAEVIAAQDLERPADLPRLGIMEGRDGVLVKRASYRRQLRHGVVESRLQVVGLPPVDGVAEAHRGPMSEPKCLCLQYQTLLIMCEDAFGADLVATREPQKQRVN